MSEANPLHCRLIRRRDIGKRRAKKRFCPHSWDRITQSSAAGGGQCVSLPMRPARPLQRRVIFSQNVFFHSPFVGKDISSLGNRIVSQPVVSQSFFFRRKPKCFAAFRFGSCCLAMFLLSPETEMLRCIVGGNSIR